MLAVFLVLMMAIYLAFFFPMEAKAKKVEEKSPKYNEQMGKLWQIAQTSMKERKPFRAEKALLTILKFDEKNAAAYNRLGILYAKSQKYDEAVECFEIAQSLDSNAASFHNVGLIYLETGNYEKAAMAFRQAIEMEGDVPARYIALAKAEEEMGNKKKAIEALESAYELDPKVAILRQILAIYEGVGNKEAAAAVLARIEEKMAKHRGATRAGGATGAGVKTAGGNVGAGAKTAETKANVGASGGVRRAIYSRPVKKRVAKQAAVGKREAVGGLRKRV